MVGEALVNDIVRGIAAHGRRAVDAVFGGVGERRNLFAVLFFVALAGSALAAGVDDYADGRDAANFEFLQRCRRP